MSEKKSKNHNREKLTVLIDKDIKKEITIVPISGRVLIKEGKYEV